MTVEDGCVTLTKVDSTYCTFKQSVNLDERNIKGKTVTAAIKIKSCTGEVELRLVEGASASSDSNAFAKKKFTEAGIILLTYVIPETSTNSFAGVSIAIISDTGSYSIEWAALYEGEYNADNIPVYQPKGYGAELAECQRYYVRFTDVFQGMGSVSNNAKGLYPVITIPSPMRITPTCSCSGSVTARNHAGYLTEATWSDPQQNVDVVLDSIFATSVVLNVKKSDGTAWSGITNNTLVLVYFREGTILELSADL